MAVVLFNQRTSLADCENFRTHVTPASVVLKMPGPPSIVETLLPPTSPTCASRKSIPYMTGQSGKPDIKVHVAPPSVVRAVAPFEPANPTLAEMKSICRQEPPTGKLVICCQVTLPSVVRQ